MQHPTESTNPLKAPPKWSAEEVHAWLKEALGSDLAYEWLDITFGGFVSLCVGKGKHADRINQEGIDAQLNAILSCYKFKSKASALSAALVHLKGHMGVELHTQAYIDWCQSQYQVSGDLLVLWLNKTLEGSLGLCFIDEAVEEFIEAKISAGMKPCETSELTMAQKLDIALSRHPTKRPEEMLQALLPYLSEAMGIDLSKYAFDDWCHHQREMLLEMIYKKEAEDRRIIASDPLLLAERVREEMGLEQASLAIVHAKAKEFGLFDG